MFIYRPDIFTPAESYSVRVFGPLQLVRQDGIDVTPRAAKTQALFAMLVLANGSPIHRSTLQARLWSDRMQAQGRDSLKHALSELRRVFGPDSSEILLTEGGPVSLNMDRLRTDLHGDIPTHEIMRSEFLEGIEVRDAEFEDWLRDIRQRLGNPPATPVQKTMDATRQLKPSNLRLKIGIAPVSTIKNDLRARLTTEIFLQRIVAVLVEEDFFEIWDLSAETDAGSPSDIILASNAFTSGGEVVMRFFARSNHDSSVVWTHEHSETLSGLSHFTALIQARQLGDQLIEKCMNSLVSGSPERFQASRFVLEGIDQMFRVGQPNLELAEKAFDAAIELEERGTFLAWRAYLNAFRYEKTFGKNKGTSWDRTEELAARALAADRHNPLVAALLAHLYGFVGRDFNRAFELLDPVKENHKESLMLQDSLALFHFYTGNIAKAEHFAQTAANLGRCSPHRFLFTTTQAMVALVKGDLDAAIRYAERAKSQQPLGAVHIFEPNLRTLAAAHGLAGNVKEGARAMALIRKQSPGFALEAFESSETTPIPNPQAFEIIRNGLEKANDFTR